VLRPIPDIVRRLWLEGQTLLPEPARIVTLMIVILGIARLAVVFVTIASRHCEE